MTQVLKRYARWLHTRWPAGTVEKLPEVQPDGRTNLAGVRVVGDLTGIPLLKFSADSGARAVQALLTEPDFKTARGKADEDTLELAIIGGGVSGCAAALEAQRAGLRYTLFEASQTFATLKNFPKGKPIYTYPTDMTPAGELRFGHQVKEPLIEDLERQIAEAGVRIERARVSHIGRSGGALWVHHGEGTKIRALRVIVGIGRSGNYRKLGVPGEQRTDKVQNRLHDPRVFDGKQVLIVGGGDSAMEAAIALACCGAHVTLSYRKPEFSRPKPENVEKLKALAAGEALPGMGVERPTSARQTTALSREMVAAHKMGTLRLEMGSQVQEIGDDAVELRRADGTVERLPNDAVFPMIGREAPLDFFRRSGIRVTGEWTRRAKVGLVGFLAFCLWLYHWKSYGWFAFDWLDPKTWVGHAALDPASLLYTLRDSASKPSFYYTLTYSSLITVYGIRRIQRRRTPYVTRQTISLMFFQWLPLFLLPEIILPLMGRNGLFLDGHALRPIADLFFEPYDGGLGVDRAYWRAYGFILAWPLMVYNWFTDAPIWGWLGLGTLQTFVIIPLMVRRWGKGAFCGWVCSCGGLAETLGDTHRHKMPHGPLYNRLNLIGQVILAVAFLLLGLRIWGWLSPESWAAAHFAEVLHGRSPLSYKWLVDITLAGFLGVGLYFHYSGRVWCRFACPLAALMHIYGRFSRFRIFPEKKKCISCNVCTATCHQGIDIMSFANKGLPMEDPECVRCSACVQSCPTGVLRFGRIGAEGAVIYDRVPASLVQMTEALAGRS